MLSRQTSVAYDAYLDQTGARAMAVSQDGLVFGVARCAEGSCGVDVRAEAVRECERANRLVVDARDEDEARPSCRLFAYGSRQLWRGEVTRTAIDAPLDLGFSPTGPARRGPEAARGVVLILPGHDPRAPARPVAAPAALAALAARGFDLELGQFAPGEIHAMSDGDIDDALRRAVADRRALGYEKIVLAGHSFGAWSALRAAGPSAVAVDAVLAAAPARHGPAQIEGRANPAFAKNKSGLLPLLRAARAPTAVMFFADDPFDPGDRARLAEKALRASGAARLVIDRPPESRGHDGFWTTAFARRYGACLARFVVEPPRRGPAACAPDRENPPARERSPSAGLFQPAARGED